METLIIKEEFKMEKKVIDAETKQEIEVSEKKTWKDKLPSKDGVKKGLKKAALFGAGVVTGVLGCKLANRNNNDDVVEAEVTEEEVYTSEF